VNSLQKIKSIAIGILLLLIMAVWGCNSAREAALGEIATEKEHYGNFLAVNGEQENPSSENGGQKVSSTEESSVTITGKIVIFAKGTRSETIAIEVTEENQETIDYSVVGSLGYSLREREGETVTVVGHLTDSGFSIVPGPHLWVDEIEER
jgi:hypothetical protein